MNVEDIVARVAERAPASEDDARQALVAVLETLGDGLSRLEANALADALPSELAQLLREPPHGESFGLSEFYARVARRERIELARAVEHAQVVCQLLAEVLDADALNRARAELRPAIGGLLRPREAFEPLVRLRRGRRTLAEGRPGSQRPLAEARPGRAQSQSVAAEENPHGETKLSSARGLTQERESDSLATHRE